MEFKRLSDVEVVAEPAESANVLIEEDGVIKKAPKTAVGGGGEWDAVIHFDGSYLWNNTLDSASFTSGSYETIKAKLDVFEMPKVLITCGYNYGDDYISAITPISYDMVVGGNITMYAICYNRLHTIILDADSNIIDNTVTNLSA